MGLRCLLSHDFGEPELERERDEQGNEVVITVNEVKTCTRCGERRVVSENTEVTSMDQLTATAADDSVSQPPAEADQPADTAQPAAATADAEPAGAATESTAGVTIDDSESVTDDAEILTDDGDDGDTDDATGAEDLGAAEPANMTVDDVEAAAAESVQTADDDGVILPSDADEEPADAEPAPETDATADAEPDTEADRQPGEWPEYDDGDEPADGDHDWPDVEGDDEGFAADEPSEEAPEDMTFGGGFTPEITDTEPADGEEPQLSFTRAEEASVEYEPTVDDIETEFYCPECGFSRLAGDSSMRAGDICPDCRRGYISERPT